MNEIKNNPTSKPIQPAPPYTLKRWSKDQWAIVGSDEAIAKLLELIRNGALNRE